MISVCIATYNGAPFIAQQLQSVLPQLAPLDEVIVSDDGSTDGTLQVVQSLADPRIRIVQGPRLHSPIKNFEHALSLAKGDLIFLCDQDDVWTPDKVAVMTRALQNYACVVSDCYVTDARLNVVSPSFRQRMGYKESRWYNLFIRNSYSGSCMAFRREVVQKALPIPSGILMHDIWLGNVAAFHFSLTFVPDRLIYFRRHQHSASTAGFSSTNPLWLRISSRLRTAWQLLALGFK